MSGELERWIRSDLGVAWSEEMLKAYLEAEEIGRRMEEMMAVGRVDRNGHPIERGDYVKVFEVPQIKAMMTHPTRPVNVLGRVVAIIVEMVGKGTTQDPRRERATYRICCGIRAEAGKESRGAVVFVDRWKDGVEYIGTDRVKAAQAAFGVWIP